MIEYPIATSKNDERFKAFKESEQSIESLLVFDDSYDREVGSLYAQSLVKKILVHYEDIQFEDIKNKLIQYKDLFAHNLSIDDLASSLMNKKISLRTLDNFIEKSKDKLKNLVADSIIHNISEFAPKNIYAELFDNAQKSHTYIQVQEEINKDIDLLKEIISNIVLKAAKIEKQGSRIKKVAQNNKLHDFHENVSEIIEPTFNLAPPPFRCCCAICSTH